MTLNEHILSKIDNIVYSRYGYDYLFQFQPGNISETYPIGSHRINLDYLIYQKQKMLTSDERGSYVISRPNVLSQRINVRDNCFDILGDLRRILNECKRFRGGRQSDWRDRLGADRQLDRRH